MLIPFGLKDNKYFDVSEVERGRKCGCVCPSCKQNLVAKKGDPNKMAHHFAHDKKAKKDHQDKVECQYSFCVVARLIIKQCFRELTEFEIVLPEWTLVVEDKDKYGRLKSVSGLVTQSQSINITDFTVEPESPFDELDIIAKMGRYHIGFHFSYDGRPCIIDMTNHSVSVVDIDLEPLESIWVCDAKSQIESFKSVVMQYVLKGEKKHRQWVSHARYPVTENKLRGNLNKVIEESNQVPPLPSIPVIETIKPKPYKKPKNRNQHAPAISKKHRSPDGFCVACQQGKADYIDDLICARCLQHYYARGIYHTPSIKKAVIREYLP